MEFCTPFDEAMARTGPPGVFLPDAEGLLRFQVTWTRDLHGRTPGPHEPGWCWVLARDKGSGFVQLVLVTSRGLLPSHPRLELRHFDELSEAQHALAAMGTPPVDPQPWS